MVLIFIGVAICILWYFVNSDNQKARKKEQQRLFDLYRAAIASGNKADALSKGRAYYRYQREDGNLTIYDEQAITNDLSTM